MRTFLRRLALALFALTAVLGAWIVVDAHRRATALGGEARRLAAGAGPSTSDLPGRWIDWLLLVEDPRFRSHHGVDLRTPGAGWTTLTQALVKLHFPGPRRGPVGKPLQSVRALVLDAAVTKEEQLTLVLNTAYFGDEADGPVLGFSAAAHLFHGRDLVALEDDEFLGLVAMLIGPNRFHPVRSPQAHAERLQRIRRLVGGRCAPSSWNDVFLSLCDPG